MRTLAPADLDRIEQLARAATPGPYRDATADPGREGTAEDTGFALIESTTAMEGTSHKAIVDGCGECQSPWMEPCDRAYLAALDPDTVLALVEAARTARCVALRWAAESPYLPDEDSPEYAAACNAEADKILNYSCPSGCCQDPRCDSIAP